MIVETISKYNVVNFPATFEINSGKTTAIVGKNGRGKTTLLRMLSGNVLPGNGKITLEGKTYCFPIKLFDILKYQKAFRDAVLYIEDQSYL